MEKKCTVKYYTNQIREMITYLTYCVNFKVDMGQELESMVDFEKS